MTKATCPLRSVETLGNEIRTSYFSCDLLLIDVKMNRVASESKTAFVWAKTRAAITPSGALVREVRSRPALAFTFENFGLFYDRYVTETST